MPIPQEYLEVRRPVSPELDAVRYLQAASQAYKNAPASYFGLTPENINASSQAKQQQEQFVAGLMNQYLNQAIQQDSQRFADAQRAHSMQMADESLRLQQAAHALAAQRLSMEQALMPMKMQLQNLQLQDAQNKLKLAQDMNSISIPIKMPDGSTSHMSLAQAKEAGLAGKNLEMEQALKTMQLANAQAVLENRLNRAPTLSSVRQSGLANVFSNPQDVQTALAFGVPALKIKIASDVNNKEKEFNKDAIARAMNPDEKFDKAAALSDAVNLYAGGLLSSFVNPQELLNYLGISEPQTNTVVNSGQNLNQDYKPPTRKEAKSNPNDQEYVNRFLQLLNGVK